MSLNTSIEGSGIFHDNTENAGTVTNAEFYDSATNTGTVEQTATFTDSAANHGDVDVAVFEGNSQNTGTVANAIFRGSAVNAGTVSVSATFEDNASNTGTVADASFTGTSVNNGGTVTGTANFALSTTNSGTVNNLIYAAGYVISAGFINYITINGQYYENGTYDVVADGNGGTNITYTYLSSGTLIYDDTISYVYRSDGAGTYNQYAREGYVIQNDVVNYILINGLPYTNGTYDEVADGFGGSYNNYTYFTYGDVIFDDGTTWVYRADSAGGYNQYYRQGYIISTANNYITINGTQYTNGTYDVVADGYGGTSNQYYYIGTGSPIANDITVYSIFEGVTVDNGTVDYISDGNGNYYESDRDYPEVGQTLHSEPLYVTIEGSSYEAGNWKIEADGVGGGSRYNYWTGQGEVITNINGVDYISDGNGGYTTGP